MGATLTAVVVLPVYNDSRRLADFAPQLAAMLPDGSTRTLLCIADDGSTASDLAATRRIVADLRRLGSVSLLKFPHRGKGATVKKAWESFPEARWLAFADADGSTPAEEIRRLLVQAEKSDASCVVGERTGRSGTVVRNSFRRVIAHHAFAMFANWMLEMGVPDPQCGIKVIRGEAFRAVAGNLREPGFAFDCELLAALNKIGEPIESVPVNWEERSGGSIVLLRDIIPMSRALWRIRRRVG